MSITMSKTNRSKYTTQIKLEKWNKFTITIFDETMKKCVTDERTSLKGAFGFAESWINEQQES